MRSLSIRSSNDLRYPTLFPYDMDTLYPEFSGTPISAESNTAFRDVRQCLIDLELDKGRVGTGEWSPFSEFVSPGDTVVIKPNFVLNTANPEIQECTTTHPSIIRPVIDYCWKALEGQGRIVVGDAPGAEADFDALMERSNIRKMIKIIRDRGVNVELEDFRAVKVTTENGVWTGEQRVNREAPTSQIVNLGTESQFYSWTSGKAKLHGAGYDIEETTRHHRGTVQEYSVSKTILNADVVISLPKLKTHRKAGLTCCLKNLVGINTDKNYLPHFTMGSSNMGGDEMPAIEVNRIWRLRSYNWFRENIIAHFWRFLGKPAVALLRLAKRKKADHNTLDQTGNVQRGKKPVNKDTDLARWFHTVLSGQPVAAGAWAGNETICRMILDLNKIFLCCDKNGALKNKTDRKIFYIVDAVTVGMGNGPTHPLPVEVNTVAAGWNGLRIDISLLNLFGIDEESIPLYEMAKKQTWMHADEEGAVFFNGHMLTKKDALPKALIAPEGWNYRTMDKKKA